MDELDDPSILTGISKIVNPRKVDTKLDLDSIERELMGNGGLKPVAVKNSEQELTDILKDIRTEPISRMVLKSPSHVQKPKPAHDSLSTLQRFVSKTNPSVPFGEDDEVDDFGEAADDSEDFGNDWEGEPDELSPSIGSNPTIPSVQPPQHPAYYNPQMQPPQSAYYNPHQQQMQHQQHIQPQQGYRPVIQVPQMPQRPYMQATYAQEALQAYAGDHEQQEAALEQERLEDQKEKMISDIEDLREELNADQIKTDRIPEVTIDSPYSDVSKVYKQIKRKYDRSRCEGLGESIMMAAARMTEMVFNGQRSYFGFRPDMTGWNRTVRSKMRRMRFEQSIVVSNMLEYYNVGPVQRMGLELIPSAFLYSLTRREQHGQNNYTPDSPNVAPTGGQENMEDDRSAALADLQEFDN